MGRRLPPGARGQLSLRLRLLAAAAGIVVVSLLLGGALTWVLVRDLVLQSAQEQLDRQVVSTRVTVLRAECLVLPRVPTNTNCPGARFASPGDFTDRLNLVASQLGGARLLLLDGTRSVVYDSSGAGTNGVAISPQSSGRVANIGEAQITLDGQRYLVAVAALPPARDPLGASYMAIAEPESLVASSAAGDLALRLIEAGGVALVVAMLLVLLVSRSLTGPLTQLASAAEDIAGGNYSRRVNLSGDDEIGLLGSAFNRMAEAVERARRVQRDFLANVSHELKTPLTSLIGFSQALVDGSLVSDAERTRAATIVHEESERVLRMAQELLDLARVEAGSISMHITAVDLGAQLQQELEIVRPRAAARRLQLNLSAPDVMPPVAADPERLHQVLDNLLDNAVKYAPEGATIQVVSRQVGDGVETVLSNPAGVSRPDPNRMFDRFYRGDPSRSAAAGGVGLGLAISRELCLAMRGRLWAELDQTGSLRMHLVLPARREGASRPSPAAPAAVA